jgi:Integrase zinc binding domain
VADALSRPPPVTAPTAANSCTAENPIISGERPGDAAAGLCCPLEPGLDYAAIAVRQRSCLETSRLLQSSSLKIKNVKVAGMEILCDVSTGSARPVIPAADWRPVFDLIHNLAHPGIRATRRLLACRVVWRGLVADAARWCRDCQQCQRSKVTVQPVAAMEPIPVTSSPSLTARHVGWRRCRSQILRPPRVWTR